jgi:hypothetical protein
MNRSIALMTLTEGNIFHATTPNGASFICLVTSVAKSQIWARRVTTQEQLARPALPRSVIPRWRARLTQSRHCRPRFVRSWCSLTR